MPAVDLRPRSTGELIDATFHVYRNHFSKIAPVCVILFIPYLLADLTGPDFYGGDMTFIHSAFNLLGGLAVVLVEAALVLIVSDIYMGKEASPAAAIRKSMSRFGSLVAASIFRGLALFVGIILLVVPAFIFFAWYFAAPATVILEDRGYSDAVARSKDLSKNHKVHILKALVGMWLLFFLLIVVGGIIMGVVSSMLPSGGELLISISVMAILSLLIPLPLITATLLYYDMRIRLEGFDLEILSQNTGTPQAAPLPQPAL